MKNANPIIWFFVGPVLLLIAAAAYAAMLQLAILFDRQQAALGFLSRVAERLESARRAGSAIWGCAIFVALLAVAAVLLNHKPLALFGILALFALALLLGLACAASALLIERRLSDPLALGDSTPPWPPNGWKTLFLASALPLVGWIGGAALITTALGLIAEMITARLARRAR